MITISQYIFEGILVEKSTEVPRAYKVKRQLVSSIFIYVIPEMRVASKVHLFVETMWS